MNSFEIEEIIRIACISCKYKARCHVICPYVWTTILLEEEREKERGK